MSFRFYLNGKPLSTVNIFEAQRIARRFGAGQLTGFNPATQKHFVLLY